MADKNHKMPTKIKFFNTVFYSLLFEDSCASVFIDKKVKKKSQNSRIKVFLTLFACCWKDPDPDVVPNKIITIRIREAQNHHTNPTAPKPDPQHCI